VSRVPGRVTRVTTDADGLAMGTVDFGGLAKDVCLAWLPGVAPGDYVVVHVGFAIARVDEAGAHAVFALLEQLGQLDELAAAGGDAP